MARWTPGARDRLQAAAFDVIRARGFDAVTVAEIAEAAGVTERTFFRHFADKREVLFDGQSTFVTAVAEAVAAAPARHDAVAAVRHGFDAAAEMFPDERRPRSRARGAIIAADEGLSEREAQKMRSLAVSIAAALDGRGVPEPEASLVARAAVGVFEVAFAAWIAEGETRGLREIQTSLFDRLGALLAG
ncbi:TetR family transcriptional regulator [Microbacterium sp. 10M-3C3]|jgi:AcrR family transcriptional regulator|uniref:TetR family transcriptional regulator n=1 Tax=Microbacterium sp. 10M-3C3 TaxID=2483401 RepID=UPI000F62D5B5|nr:TetR family transcriptional regulator [Microbacterium sp. 10M-3C3]